MTRHEEIQRVIEQAKQQRAEVIGVSLQRHPILTLLALAMPFVLSQIDWVSETPLVAQLQGEAQVERLLQ